MNEAQPVYDISDERYIGLGFDNITPSAALIIARALRRKSGLSPLGDIAITYDEDDIFSPKLVVEGYAKQANDDAREEATGRINLAVENANRIVSDTEHESLSPEDGVRILTTIAIASTLDNNSQV